MVTGPLRETVCERRWTYENAKEMELADDFPACDGGPNSSLHQEIAKADDVSAQIIDYREPTVKVDAIQRAKKRELERITGELGDAVSFYSELIAAGKQTTLTA
eukprot:CAMPEP_0185575172 /NCGR_PEP_ID=MMETSP0434-20130131/6442_1 /TAXON_ID=626734 ORGANISM="Favella taraikaensis, Strain Fe Narragansett Bay" /NCGR_SAMPLE_ID=MMETSP0434 /ASSEMBLY_ACC=CAM_ASM_000379 /LENGTH=103 /DNA_ID=CAMNT_0028191977 /DNA_START=446 /DNA_END=757 /DNA_ORIENTATION=+